MTDIVSAPLGKVQEILAATYAACDTRVEEVEQDLEAIKSTQFPSAQFLTGKITRWQHMKGELLKRKSKGKRIEFAARRDFETKYWDALKNGPLGRQQANGFAFEERKAAAMSRFVVEHTKWELMIEANNAVELAIDTIDAHMWGVKNTQQVVKMEHDDAKYASTKDYID